MIFLDNFLKKINYYEKFKECDHGENNIYHKERYLYNHVELIFSVIEKFKLNPDKEIFYKLLAIFHDIGKIYTRFEEKGRVYFRGHAYMSTLISLEFSDLISKYIGSENLNNFYKIIFYHMLVHNPKEFIYLSKFDFSNKLFTFKHFDENGKIGENKNREFNKEYIIDNKNIDDKKSEKEILYLYGIPGSGKSYFVNSFLKNISKDEKYYIVSRDSIIQSFANNMGLTYREFYKLMYENKTLYTKVNKNFNDMLKESKNYDKIIIDMTNLVKKRRRQFIHFYGKDKYKHKILIFLRPYSEILKFNKNRNGKDLSDILIKLIQTSTPPSFSEGFDEILFKINF